MQSGECKNCGADYGPNDVYCSFCGSPIEREQEGYGGFDQQSYQASNGGTQVIQNIYVNSNGSGNTNIGDSLNDVINRLGQSATSHTTGSTYDYRSNYTRVRSRLAAAIIAIIFGWAGAQFFYLGKYGLGIACLIFMGTGIPAIVGIIQGVLMLKMSDAEFEVRYHVRTS